MSVSNCEIYFPLYSIITHNFGNTAILWSFVKDVAITIKEIVRLLGQVTEALIAMFVIYLRFDKENYLTLSNSLIKNKFNFFSIFYFNLVRPPFPHYVYNH